MGPAKLCKLRSVGWGEMNKLVHNTVISIHTPTVVNEHIQCVAHIITSEYEHFVVLIHLDATLHYQIPQKLW